MLKLALDAKSPFRVRWPRRDAAAIRLAQAFLTAEAGRAEAERFPRLDLIQQRLEAAMAAGEKAQAGEAERSAVSAAEQQAFSRAATLVRKIVAGLTYRHLDELPVLEQWGVAVVQTQFGPRTRTPQAKLALLEMLTRYVQREESLPEAERLADPPLAEVIAVRDALQTAMAERQSARTRREVGVRTRTVEAQALRDLLQAAAVYHVVVHFGGAVDPRLQELGFDVIEV